MRYDDRQVTIQVDDDGHAVPAPVGSPRTGHGQLGMRERVAVWGGTLHAGPRPEGGYRVTATLPYEPQEGP